MYIHGMVHLASWDSQNYYVLKGVKSNPAIRNVSAPKKAMWKEVKLKGAA